MEKAKNMIPTCLLSEITGLTPVSVRKIRNTKERTDHHGVLEAEQELCRAVQALKTKLHRSTSTNKKRTHA